MAAAWSRSHLKTLKFILVSLGTGKRNGWEDTNVVFANNVAQDDCADRPPLPLPASENIIVYVGNNDDKYEFIL